MATRKQVNDLYQQYLGRDATKEGLDYWTSQGLSLSGIEYNIANSPEAQAKVSTARGMFDINDPAGGPVKVTIGETSLPGDVDYGEIPSDLLINTDIQREFFQDFIEIFRESQEDSEGRLERQTQAAEWLRVLGEYAVGNATEEDLKAVDVSDLMDVSGFEDYYYGIVPRPETEDTEEETKTLQDYIDEFGEDAVNTAQGIYDDVSGYIEGAIDDPLGTLVSILDVVVDAGIPEKCQDLKDCRTADPDKGTYCWKDCVNFSVLAGIPGLPNLPGMQDVGTYRDFEDAVKEIGTTIGDVIEGNANCGENNDQDCTVTQVLEDAGTWVMKKIEGVLKDIDDASIDDAYDWIKGIFGAAVGGFVFSQVKEEIEDLFLPVATTVDTPINCADYGREGGEVGSVDECGNCLDKTEDIGTDGRCRKFFKDDFDVSEVETTCKREGKEYNDLLDECGDCIKANHAPGPDGVCAPIDGDVNDEVDPRCSNPAFAARNPSLCGGQTTYTEGPGFGFGGQPPETRCTDVNATVNEDGSCGDCKNGFTKNPNTGKCVPSGNGGGGGDTTEVYDPDCETDPRPTGVLTFDLQNKQRIWDRKCGGEDGGGNSGSTTTDDKCKEINSSNYYECGKVDCFTDNTPGPFVDRFSDCPGSGGGDGGGTTTTGCSNGATEESGCDTCPDGTSVLQYEDGICPSVSPPPECNDCTCAEYAAANPEECGTGGGGGGGGGGSGGGAGGSSGMFDLESFEITGDPQLLAKIEFPITDFLSGMFKDYV